MTQVQTFSKGKLENKNEDFFDYDQKSFIVADGATDKSGRKYGGKTGGELISRIVVNQCLKTSLNRIELVNHLNCKVKKLYKKLNILKKIKNPKYRFSCSFICARLIKNKIIITYLGDSGFRINGSKVYQKEIQIDINNSKERSKYIRATNDIKGSRNHIMPLLLKQSKYQNNPQKTLGYGIIDGTKTPSKFVETFEYNLNKIKTIELFTDGYFNIPQETSIQAWEKAFKKVDQEDPDRWKKYPSTKSKDDRTIAIIRF